MPRPDLRERIYKEMLAYLDNIVTPNYSIVYAENVGDEEIRQMAEEGLQYVTMVCGAILPITFTVKNQYTGGPISMTMLVNPENMNHGKTNAAQTLFTRNGWVVQLWGPNQDTISSTGKTACFMSPVSGLDNVGERRSMAFKNLMAFIATYRNNGYIYKGARGINTVTGVEMTYDGDTVMGHFNTFTLDNNAEQPFIMNYNFEFICSQLSSDYRNVRGHFIPVAKLPDPAPLVATAARQAEKEQFLPSQ